MKLMYEPEFRCQKNGVPILSHKEIEDDAENFIKDFDADILKHPRAVDIEKFVEFYLGLTLEYNNLSHCGLILGRMVFNDTDRIPIYDAESRRAEYISASRGTVIIDNTIVEDEHRLRSTMGHEAGHWIYQQSYYYTDPQQLTLFGMMDMMGTACRKSDIEGGDGTKRTLTTDHDWLEHQAKYFSAAILMPREAMRVVCGDEAVRRNLTAEAPGFEEIFLANHVAKVFNVSVESARIRIKQLEYDFEPVMHNNPAIFTIGYPERVFSL